jgi:capsular exopolysaccharide synthesis family protein
MIENVKGRTPKQPEKVDILVYGRVVWKRRWLVLMFAAVVLASAAVETFTSTPLYSAAGMLLIEKEPNILSFEDIFQIETLRDDYYQTQFKLLKSYALAERTVEKLGLPEKAARDANAKRKKKNGKTVDPKDPGLKRDLAESLMKAISVKPVRLTRLVEVGYSDPDPEMAAQTVNTLFEAFIDLNVEAKYEATAQASEFLTDQIRTYRSEIESAQQKLQSYGASKNIIALSDKETTTIEKLGELNRALTEATIERIKKETYYNEIKIASAEYIPETMTNPLIQRLRESYVALSRDYEKKTGTYGPEYPEMQRLKSELETTRLALESETKNLIKGAYSDFQAALKRELSLTKVFNDQKTEAERLNSNAISYYSLENDIENKKSLLEMLMKRESETGVSARLRGLRTSNIRIADKARVPASPSSPNKKRNLLLALFLGLFGGMGIAYLLEYFDNSVKTSEDVERSVGLPTLGTIPEFSVEGYKKGSGYGYGYGQGGSKKKKKEAAAAAGGEEGKAEKAEEPKVEKAKPITRIELITHFARNSNFSESYRSIRTALLLSSAGPSRKTMIITSPLPSEGKSANVSNFAVTLAQNGKRVLVVDADLRKPRQHRIFGVKNLHGLTNYLTVGLAIKDLIKPTNIENLYLVNSGPLPPNPAELLGSERMAALLDDLKNMFDYILLDTPPVLAVTDALVLAPHTDGVIMIVWSGKTPRESLRMAKEKLDMMNIKTLGVVINHLNLRDLGYYYKHYHYRGYEAGGGAQD